MKTRRHIIVLAAVAAFGPLLTARLAPAIAAAALPFSNAAFEAAQQSGRPILIVVSAPWCPICRTQKPILAKLADEPRFKDLQIFDIDFDSQKSLLKRLDVRTQSTLIAYKGAKEVGRSVGETQPEWIEGLVEKTL
ncbi:Thiol-disulfide isomerase or thioredoxin [Methylobacterium phyllostachyos]|uniref:Thiol-disulfide isomerase or thioredoxin n=1 Tax=Methylobacterium phyllostachyos TaxID=582672 RepID=A0A1G9Z408_9HYPH|nr:thioredoxin family protein [Methylobacterium phyllostachyos]SDN15501.1 Thiol-disulfide isomerase or thioredoxin [Methylobacterium phyllostachyos]